MPITPDDLKQTIREVPDFPKPGINFYDVSTLFQNSTAFRAAVDSMVEPLGHYDLDALVGIEARGFILAAAMAYKLDLGLVLARKHGKLPGQTIGERYALEYGEAHIEMHDDSLSQGKRVVVVDDLLATGGTAKATARLVERLGATMLGYSFMVELDFLSGRESLGEHPVHSLIHYA